ncbi:MAG: Na+:solute symporter [Bacteroidetes bacterium]|nr:MAG: Na+:solute symporter [Bacteroidota bacterium]
MTLELQTIDWVFIVSFFAISLAIGLYAARTAGKNTSEFFLSGRNMPWWLLGMSMVATTFSTDTPNLVTDIVRQHGVAGNWAWWAFLLTGMLTVFVYAKLWRRSGVTTDIEFYEMRYKGPAASFLRAFRALYLGIAFNVLSMAAVSLAAIKIGEVMLGLPPLATIGIASLVTVIFSSLGGFKGVILTDFLLFFVAMIGAFGAAVVAVGHPDVGGLGQLFAHEQLVGKLSLLPDFSNPNEFIPILLIPLAIQWWASWYPGAEPGGGGYVAQRMLAAKNENHAISATFFFNIAHYALRPWPWIIVALASLVVFPDLDSLHQAFPNISDDKLGHDLAYPAMLTFLPNGLLGLVLTSLVAAFMSTISTHLNWGSSYVVNDFYRRFVKPEASEKELVAWGRVSTVLMMVLAALLALQVKNAKQLFDFIILFGAGTGLIFILRWFWWRINAWSEIVAMFASGIISLLVNPSILSADFESILPDSFPVWSRIVISVGLTTVIWLVTTFLTKPEDEDTLIAFYQKTHPGGPGWNHIRQAAARKGMKMGDEHKKWDVPDGILAMLMGCVLVYSTLFATGNWLYGHWIPALLLTGLAIAAAYGLYRLWSRIGGEVF